MSDIIKEYSNEEVTIIWQPAKCSHSAICAKSLNDVFNPKTRPWINMQGSDTDTIIHTVKQCPSGALSIKGYERDIQSDSNDISVKIFKNGPMIVQAQVAMTMADGSSKEVVNPVLCRCGKSQNKPFCDGAHVKSGFTG